MNESEILQRASGDVESGVQLMPFHRSGGNDEAASFVGIVLATFSRIRLGNQREHVWPGSRYGELTVEFTTNE